MVSGPIAIEGCSRYGITPLEQHADGRIDSSRGAVLVGEIRGVADVDDLVLLPDRDAVQRTTEEAAAERRRCEVEEPLDLAVLDLRDLPRVAEGHVDALVERHDLLRRIGCRR